LVFVAANDNARAGLNRSAPYHFFLERGVLEYQSLQCQRSAIDHVHCLLFEPGRALLGQAVSRVFLAVAPIMVLGWLTQKQLVRGLTFGAVK